MSIGVKKIAKLIQIIIVEREKLKLECLTVRT